MFKMPSEYDPRVWENIIAHYSDEDAAHDWAVKYFAGYIYSRHLYEWQQIPSAFYDKKTNKSFLTSFSIRMNPTNLASLLHIFYDTDEAPHPFMVVFTFDLCKGENPTYFISKIAIYKSNETCTEIHGDSIGEWAFTRPDHYNVYASLILGWFDKFLGRQIRALPQKKIPEWKS